MTTLYLIRHAEAEGNLFRRFHGHMNSMITPNGMKQIAALEKRFAEIPVDLCYSSDLIRTMTTAQGVAAPNGIEIHPDPAFREVDFGEWDDRPFGYLEHHCFDEIEIFRNSPKNWNVPGIESFEDYTHRFIKRMNELSELNSGKTIAIVSHSAVMRAVLMCLFPGTEIAPCDNTGVTKLIFKDKQYRMEFQADNSHCMPELSTAIRNKSMGEGFSRTDNLFWYRPGTEVLDGLKPPNNGEIYSVMAGDRPAGLMVLRDQDADAGILSYMGLLPYWRGRGRSIQIFGEAVYTFRKRGKTKMILQKPDNGMLDHLCSTLDLVPQEDNRIEIDIRPRVISL